MEADPARMAECDLELNLYACRDGVLMSPECMVPPRDADEYFRTCSARLGVLRCRDLGPEYCERIRKEVERRAFSFLTTEEAARVDVPRHVMPAD